MRWRFWEPPLPTEEQGFGQTNTEKKFWLTLAAKLIIGFVAVAAIFGGPFYAARAYPEYGVYISAAIPVAAILGIVAFAWHDEAQGKKWKWILHTLWLGKGDWDINAVGVKVTEMGKRLMASLPEPYNHIPFHVAHLEYNAPNFRRPSLPGGYREEYALTPVNFNDYIMFTTKGVVAGYFPWGQQASSYHAVIVHEIPVKWEYDGLIPVTMPCASDGMAHHLKSLVGEKAEYAKDYLRSIGLIAVEDDDEVANEVATKLTGAKIMASVQLVYQFRNDEANEAKLEALRGLASERRNSIQRVEGAAHEASEMDRIRTTARKKGGVGGRGWKFTFSIGLGALFLILLTTLIVTGNLRIPPYIGGR